MKNIHKLLSGFFIIILILGLSISVESDVIAQSSEPANCIYDFDYEMCFDYETFNCTCISVDPEDG